MNKRTFFKGLHYFVIINLLVEIFYCAYVVFFVLKADPSQSGPLWDAAATADFELIVKRRLYAIECWIGIVGIMIYLALTEFKYMFRKNN